MRVLVIASILLGAGPAAADRVGPAADLGLAISSASGDLGGESSVYARIGAGLQRGRFAMLVHLDATGLTPADESLDSSGLTVLGKGVGLRVDLVRRPGMYLHVGGGLSWQRLTGAEEVRRGCGVFGGCDAGFYQETPDYAAVTPWLRVAVGMRGNGPTWPGVGLELGLAPITIDRSGSAPDAGGAIVWFGVNVAIGAD